MAISDVNPFEAPPAGDNMFARITDNVSRIAEVSTPPRAWYIAFGAGPSAALDVLRQLGLGGLERYRRLGQHDACRLGFPIVNFVF